MVMAMSCQQFLIRESLGGLRPSCGIVSFRLLEGIPGPDQSANLEEAGTTPNAEPICGRA